MRGRMERKKARKTQKDFIRTVESTERETVFETKAVCGTVRNVRTVNVFYTLSCGHVVQELNHSNKSRPRKWVICNFCAEKEGYCF